MDKPHKKVHDLLFALEIALIELYTHDQKKMKKMLRKAKIKTVRITPKKAKRLLTGLGGGEKGKRK